MGLTFKRPHQATPQVRVSRGDGSQIPVRLRLLGYDGCEFESDLPFSQGEQVGIHLFRMGCIRARIVSREARIVEAEFVKDCPV